MQRYGRAVQEAAEGMRLSEGVGGDEGLHRAVEAINIRETRPLGSMGAASRGSVLNRCLFSVSSALPGIDAVRPRRQRLHRSPKFAGPPLDSHPCSSSGNGLEGWEDYYSGAGSLLFPSAVPELPAMALALIRSHPRSGRQANPTRNPECDGGK